MPLSFTVTTAGREALVNANNTGTAPVEISEIGISETAVVADPADTQLADEIKRIDALPGMVVADDTVHVVMLDISADVYSMRSFALYLGDGTLFGTYGQADPILEKTALSIAALPCDITFADIDAASVTFDNVSFVNPPATSDEKGVVELATQAEAATGTDAARAITPATGKAAVLQWLLSQDGSGSGLDADLLDGLDSTGFLKTTDAATFGGNAGAWWEKRANGIIEQGGLVNNHTEGERSFTVNFPVAFANVSQILNIIVTPVISEGQVSDPFAMQINYGALTKSKFEVSLRTKDGHAIHTDGFHWRVVGRLV